MSAPEPVLLRPGGSAPPQLTWPAAERLAPEALASAQGADLIALGVTLAEHLGVTLAGPGEGHTRELWEVLASLGASDLTLARIVEPHLDAVAILRQAGIPENRWPRGLLGVYAAEGPGRRLTAENQPGNGEIWTLSGDKPWCSLASQVGGFLVTAFVSNSERALFLVDRSAHPAPTVVDGTWASRGLAAVESPALSFKGVPAVPVGGPGWYLERPGFAWGGMGVAAVWHGGAVGVARRLHAQARQRELDQIGQMHLGSVDGALHRSRAVLDEAARLIDAGLATGADGARLALRVRQTARASAESVLAAAAHAMGPAPLTGEELHARRVADLTVYLRQEHAERDQAALGRGIAGEETLPW